jgi:succinyl-CoA synthetase beta subunit
VPGIAHKAAMGGVQLNLQFQREVQDAAQRMLDLPGATTDSLLLIEPMLSGMEFFVGVTQSMEFGFLGLLGLGGGQVEDKARMSFRYLHLSKPDINDMLNALRLNEWLDDMCIQDTVVDQLNQIFKTLSQILIDSGGRITTIELNPVMINDQGQCTIVDALFETTSRDIQP